MLNLEAIELKENEYILGIGGKNLEKFLFNVN